MPKHAVALGYFFLAVFCMYARHSEPNILYPILTTASIFACFMGGVFFVAASIPQLQAGRDHLAKWIRRAQQPPV